VVLRQGPRFVGATGWRESWLGQAWIAESEIAGEAVRRGPRWPAATL